MKSRMKEELSQDAKNIVNSSELENIYLDEEEVFQALLKEFGEVCIMPTPLKINAPPSLEA